MEEASLGKQGDQVFDLEANGNVRLQIRPFIAIISREPEAALVVIVHQDHHFTHFVLSWYLVGESDDFFMLDRRYRIFSLLVAIQRVRLDRDSDLRGVLLLLETV